jgi:hypothetical protein
MTCCCELALDAVVFLGGTQVVMWWVIGWRFRTFALAVKEIVRPLTDRSAAGQTR